MRHQLTKEAHKSYKTGMHEIQGLEASMREALKPILKTLQDKIYWTKPEFEPAEYKGRDGFIPHSHNLGGLQFHGVVPKCEEYDFGFLDFGDHDEDCEVHKGEECSCGESDGHLDAGLRIWLKFEGVDDESGDLKFYLVLAGGNGDAPYFHTKGEDTYFEVEFTSKSVASVPKAASKHIKALNKLIGGAK